jgi:Protein of unknown function (DUF2569)
MTEPSPVQPALVGLRGWLALVGFGLVVAPVRLSIDIFRTYAPIFRDDTWSALTTPASEAYNPLWATLLTFEILIGVIFVAALLLLLALFFKRSRLFPTVFIATLLADPVVVLIDAWLGSFILVDETVLDPATTQELGRLVVRAIIWVPYALVSERVRNTFVE